MKKLEFTVEISASREKVWDALWSDQNYRKWTAVFIPGSYYEGELLEGNDIRFLSPGQHGLFAVVEKVIPFQSMHFVHFGLVLDGISQGKTFSENSIEYYDLYETEQGTKLTVTINTEEEYVTYFSNSFPRALHAVKELAES
ncbi:SRPBCC domain-containing protein [Chryseobacterium gotjawalense]|uniref:SRPBCC domain-containing protein n=1 Tax=Chryseobacterium gotjawalense TaxID=3042315 RepID=A0ABY8RGC0_9FLAO|nr:SRPBCC domain-containing protein [Chryseobacterium sp. wdc7]WHF52272.1 SRPBCC domain-containing protein [Chryseobacterium sp. wdc7]